MSLDTSRLTRAMFAQLDDGFAQLDAALNNMGLDTETKPQFKLFVSPDTAVEFFNYPKTTYQGMPIVVTREFPSRICLAMRSTEFLSDE